MQLVSDFGQIQIYDKADFDGDGPEWTEETLAEFAAFADQCVGLRVIENDDHEIPVSIMESPTKPGLDAWDHVVEVPFECRSGKITIAEEDFDLPIGNYTVRWSIRKTGEKGGEYQLDFIAMELRNKRVLKQI